MSDLETLKALVQQHGEIKTARRLGCAMASVYRWIRTNTPPSQLRVLRRLRAAKITPAPAAPAPAAPAPAAPAVTP